MGRQIRANIDRFVPSLARILQKRQRVKQQETHKSETMEFKIGIPCYAKKYSQNTKEEKWVPGVIIKVFRSAVLMSKSFQMVKFGEDILNNFNLVIRLTHLKKKTLLILRQEIRADSDTNAAV